MVALSYVPLLPSCTANTNCGITLIIAPTRCHLLLLYYTTPIRAAWWHFVPDVHRMWHHRLCAVCCRKRGNKKSEAESQKNWCKESGNIFFSYDYACQIQYIIFSYSTWGCTLTWVRDPFYPKTNSNLVNIFLTSRHKHREMSVFWIKLELALKAKVKLHLCC